MKQLYFLLFCFFSINMSAQTAPDFTVTDVHGVEHSLYEDYLDQGKTVVLDFFFVGCAACEFITDPFLIEAYNEWGAGEGDVEFISITSRSVDNDARVLSYEAANNVIWPGVSSDGGALEAIEYYLGPPWNLNAFPTFVVVSPERTIQFDPWSSTSGEQTIATLNEWIANTGAIGLSDITDLSNVTDFNVYPTPFSDHATIDLDLNERADVQINIFNSLGQHIKEIHDGPLMAGQQSLQLNTQDIGSGINWIKIEMNGEAHMEQLVKL